MSAARRPAARRPFASRDANGYFPRGESMLRRVHDERAVGLLYGQRALCIGALKPLNYVGTIEHSRSKLTPFRRLASTAKAFETVFFGSRAEADRVLARVARMHEHVAGLMPEDAGITPAGTPYSASDPALMLWTVAVIADSARCFFELLVRPLSHREREALWRDYLRFGELFGMPLDAAPASYPEFRRYWHEQLAGEELFLTDQARHTGYITAFQVPMPRLHQPAKRLHDLILLGSLPPRVRELYGLSYTPAQRLAFASATRALRMARPAVPRALAWGSNVDSYDRAAAIERARIHRGEPTPQVV
ncbi:MAG TPA: oxygenase MpaB family protein [Solirubrobacteraceae bacterium]|nr:oxygenase MpaB family protein [Solirubrobacteraceae bacterium]